MSLRSRLLALLLCFPGLALAVDPIRPPQPLAAPPPQAIETASGMSYIVLKPGPDANRFFSGEWVEYRADVWSSDGVTRASSRESGPVVATVRRLAAEQPGLARAILSTPVGESRRWWIQPERLLPGYPGMPNLLHVVDLTVLDDLGLAAALQRLASNITERHGVAVRLHGDASYDGTAGASRRLPSAVETVLYRVVQEALTNVVRHARAGRVDVTVRVGESVVRATVVDDGVGFRPEEHERSLGLRGLAERAELAGGTVAVRSAPGEGTTVTLEVPRG